MPGRVIGFVIWALVASCFIVYGIHLLFSKRDTAVGFWAGETKQPQVSDVKGYNRACGRLWLGYGIALLLLGTFLLTGQNTAGGIFTVLGTCWASIALAVIYSTVIENKYKKK